MHPIPLSPVASKSAALMSRATTLGLKFCINGDSMAAAMAFSTIICSASWRG